MGDPEEKMDREDPWILMTTITGGLIFLVGWHQQLKGSQCRRRCITEVQCTVNPKTNSDQPMDEVCTGWG
ncbi:hypothetical protein RHMOL_Rhmol06G0094700 [Rhododendron molle]|uniref:Uncharacterized protein n=1 Tax=Rhododendron molle TaxID=49168 RepID=A0ACC0NCJ1_RHOML|nr:hypothetical protein RHMOL_Rhmol06G0094700 [Rhododendron molle]